jgi:hypothetical protein
VSNKSSVALKKEISDMSEQKRSMRPHEAGLLALIALLVGRITMLALRAVRGKKT